MAFGFNKPDSKPKELVPAASHEAYLYSIVDYGTQKQPDYKGEAKEPARMIEFRFEFPELMKNFPDKDGNERMLPMAKSIKVKNVWTEKSNLYKLFNSVISITGAQTFDALIGIPLIVTIEHGKSESNGKVYDNIRQVAPPTEKQKASFCKPVNEVITFNIDENGFESKEFNSLKDFQKEILMESLEYKEFSTGPDSAPEELPFS
jgi:hypothetical protein